MTNLGRRKCNLTDLQTMLGDDKNILPLFSDTYSLLRNASEMLPTTLPKMKTLRSPLNYEPGSLSAQCW